MLILFLLGRRTETESRIYSRNIWSVVGKRLDRQVDAPAGRVAEWWSTRRRVLNTVKGEREKEKGGGKRRNEGCSDR